MDYLWEQWLKDWRSIADESTPTKYVAVVRKEGDSEFEVLRVSKFNAEYDEDTAHVVTTIRRFNDKTAILSRSTRDLGIVRIITNGGRPAFVIEPGADVIEWHATTEGVSDRKLVQVMRAGDLGRRVRRRDRKALKNSQAQHAAKEQELSNRVHELQRDLIEMQLRIQETEAERDALRDAHQRTVAGIIQQNEQDERSGKSFPKSATKACALGTAQEQGRKLTSSRRLPGSFGG